MHGSKGNPCIGLLLTAYVCTAGCVAEGTTPPAKAGPYKVHKLEEWRVLAAGKPIGRLVLLEVRSEEQVLTYFRAETSGGQWVGRVARDGRFFKNEPFRPIELGPRDLGLYPMKQGLALLYEVEGPITVTPMEGRGQLTEAAAHQLLRKATEKNRQ
ncbi:MAG: hypothetical protein ACYTGW_07660 [Planctomycetota bacterium]|jgi:hypothetical protein